MSHPLVSRLLKLLSHEIGKVAHKIQSPARTNTRTSTALTLLLLLNQIGPQVPKRTVADLPLATAGPRGYANFGISIEGSEYAGIDLKVSTADVEVLTKELGDQKTVAQRLTGNELEKYNHIRGVLRRHFRTEDYEHIVDGSSNFSPPHLAAFLGDMPKLHYYLQYYDVNCVARTGSTPLLLALLTQNKQMVKVLLDLGADPYYPSENNNTIVLAKKIIGQSKDFDWAFRLFENYSRPSSQVTWFGLFAVVGFLIASLRLWISTGNNTFAPTPRARIDLAPADKSLVEKQSPAQRKTKQPATFKQLETEVVLPQCHVKVIPNNRFTPIEKSLPFHKQRIHEAAWEVINRLVAERIIVDIAGGAVLAALLNRRPNDIDLVVYGEDIEKVRAHIPYKCSVFINDKSQSLKIKHPEGGIDILISQCTRLENHRKYDFTLNVIAYNANKNILIDAAPEGKCAIYDFKKTIIRPVGDAADMLKDPRRFLRMARLQAQNPKSFKIHSDILEVIDNNKLIKIPPEQLTPELSKCFLRGNALETMKILIKLELVYAIMPIFYQLTELQRKLADQFLLDMAAKLDDLYLKDNNKNNFAERHLALMLTLLLGIPLNISNKSEQVIGEQEFFYLIRGIIQIPRQVSFGENQICSIFEFFKEYMLRCFFNREEMLLVPDETEQIKKFFAQDFLVPVQAAQHTFGH
jgi:tRNA nucleotidyltransferase/poly(A) polymerase